MVEVKVSGKCHFCKSKARYGIFWLNPLTKAKEYKKVCILHEKLIGDYNEIQGDNGDKSMVRMRPGLGERDRYRLL